MARHFPLLAVLVLVAATFGRAVLGSYVYDDLALIAGSPAIAGGSLWQAVSQPLSGFAFPHWRPLTQAVLHFGHLAGGAHAIHVSALAAHLVAVVVAHRLALRRTGNAQAALFVALLFGVHPAQVETVAWCAAVNDALWGLCALLALSAHQAERARGGALVSWPVVAWCALGLLAKEAALAIPFLLLALDIFGQRTSPRSLPVRGYWRLLLTLLPWVVARMFVFGDWRAGFDRGPDLDLTSHSVLLLPFEILGRLLAVLAWPFAPSAMRPMPVEFGVADGGFAVLGAVAIAIAARTRSFGLAAVVMVLGLPALMPQGAGEYPIADRYLYLPVFGLALAVVPLLLRWRLGAGVLVVVAGACVTRSFLAVETWSGPVAFVRTHLARGEDARVLYMAGQLALEAQPPDVAQASVHFARAAELASARRFGGEDGRARLAADIAAGHGWCAFLDEARQPRPNWLRAAAIFEGVLQRHETHAFSHVGLAVCLAELLDLQSAERHLLRAIEIQPDLAAAHANLARVRARRH